MNESNSHARQSRVLIVDDEPINILILQEALKAEYQVLAVNNGRDVLTAVRQFKPDIILLDIIMPDMDGYEVCRALKTTSTLREIPVIFVSAKASEDDESIGLQMGAVDYLAKPINLAIVRQRVAIHLELKRQRDVLSRMALLDGLTGIPNRRSFDRRIKEEWRRSMRSGLYLSVTMIDIDMFKQYNDGYGHVAGDICLRRVARTLNSSLMRAGDFVARYGGEEFACVLPGLDADRLAQEAAALRACIEELKIPHKYSRVSRYVTISVGGVCCKPTQDVAPEALVTLADRQLYQAKVGGRNRVNIDVYNISSLSRQESLADNLRSGPGLC